MSCEPPHAPHSTLPATWPDPIWRLPKVHVSPPCFYVEGSRLNSDYRVKNVPRNYSDSRFSTKQRKLVEKLLFFWNIFISKCHCTGKTFAVFWSLQCNGGAQCWIMSRWLLSATAPWLAFRITYSTLTTTLLNTQQRNNYWLSCPDVSHMTRKKETWKRTQLYEEEFCVIFYSA
jgi:hypothetical protein